MCGPSCGYHRSVRYPPARADRRRRVGGHLESSLSRRHASTPPRFAPTRAPSPRGDASVAPPRRQWYRIPTIFTSARGSHLPTLSTQRAAPLWWQALLPQSFALAARSRCSPSRASRRLARGAWCIMSQTSWPALVRAKGSLRPCAPVPRGDPWLCGWPRVCEWFTMRRCRPAIPTPQVSRLRVRTTSPLRATHGEPLVVPDEALPAAAWSPATGRAGARSLGFGNCLYPLHSSRDQVVITLTRLPPIITVLLFELTLHSDINRTYTKETPSTGAVRAAPGCPCGNARPSRGVVLYRRPQQRSEREGGRFRASR